MGFTEKYEIWKKRVKDRKLLRELITMTEEEKRVAFYKDLEFGTAGIRGIMGVGTNRINIYTIRRITHGIALYMRSRRMKKAVISYDSRNYSEDFAKEAACAFAAAGITVDIVKELMPSPFLSFATRELKADIGVMITASHNPREYNGYKVYDATGCQIRSEIAGEMAEYISGVDAFRLRTHSFDYYSKRSMIAYIPDEVEAEYMSAIEKICPRKVENVSVVYTPLNGTGYRIVPEMLKNLGCRCYSVPGQETPSGKFSTCPVPNPEKREALRHGIKTLKSLNADLLIANDPDADRIGVAYISGDDVEILSGNEMGIIMSEYLLSDAARSDSPVIVKTIVSSDLVYEIAKSYGAEVISVPTGFKYIGDIINRLEAIGEEDRFLLGFEESQGYLIGTHVRDKDAVVASKIMALIADKLKREGKNFGDMLHDIYEKYGYYTNSQFSFAFSGEAGDLKMKELMRRLRTEKPNCLGGRICKVREERSDDTMHVRAGGRQVTEVIDYMAGVQGLPKLDMVEYRFDGGNVIIRPSGTEPLIKIYVCVHLSPEENEKLIKQIKNQFEEIFE